MLLGQIWGWGTECGHGGSWLVPPHCWQSLGLLAWRLPWGLHRGACPGRWHRGDPSLVPQVRDWTEDESTNQGLLVTVQGLGGSLLEPSPLQFASGKDHHESKKPMLVLFTDDGRRGASQPAVGFPGGSHAPRHSSVPLSPRLWGAPHMWLLQTQSSFSSRGRRHLLSGLVCAGVQVHRRKSGFSLECSHGAVRLSPPVALPGL